jgi:hypothetical protein
MPPSLLAPCNIRHESHPKLFYCTSIEQDPKPTKAHRSPHTPLGRFQRFHSSRGTESNIPLQLIRTRNQRQKTKNKKQNHLCMNLQCTKEVQLVHSNRSSRCKCQTHPIANPSNLQSQLPCTHKLNNEKKRKKLKKKKKTWIIRNKITCAAHGVHFDS